MKKVTLIYKSGKEITGKVISESEKGYMIELADGKTRPVNKAHVTIKMSQEAESLFLGDHQLPPDCVVKKTFEAEPGTTATKNFMGSDYRFLIIRETPQAQKSCLIYNDKNQLVSHIKEGDRK